MACGVRRMVMRVGFTLTAALACAPALDPDEAGAPGRTVVASGTPPALPSGPAQVEGLDAEGAWLLPLDGSRGVMVRRAQLPPEVREGDVIQGGKVDRQATAALHAWISEKLHEIDRAGRPVPLGRPPLTSR